MSTKAGIATIVRVEDVMSSPVVTIPHNDSVWDAAQTLTEKHINGAPVMRGGRVIGMVSKTDLLDPRNETKGRVDKVMTHLVYAVRARDPVMLAIKLMVDEDIHRAMVVNDDGGLVGIVAPIDVLRAVRNGMPLNEDAPVQVQYIDLRKLAGAAG